jgi:radical SAM superfamily enzyme YgiQ (UPF0313 family)
MPPITLMSLERLFEERGWRTILIDEQVESINFSLNADLVCVTATTTQYPRAVQIGSHFRKRGIPTVIGGIHATSLPDECRADFDTVCVGEAEGYIDDMLQDLSNGGLQSIYRCDIPVTMDSVPFLRYDLKAGKHLPFHAVSFSRGCNFGCDFCSIRTSLGRYRTRSIKPVIDHIAQSGAREIWFADAALTLNRKKARELFKALIPLNINWLSSVPFDVCLDEDMLDLMAESGCWLLSVGFETLNEENIKVVGKRQNTVKEYYRAITLLHDRKIAIEGNFIFGFDGDTEDVFDRTAKFSVDMGIDFPEFYLLTPYPGTPLYQRLSAEGRIVDCNWSHYENVHFEHLPVFKSLHMNRQQLREGCLRADRIAYSPWNTIRRLWNSRMFRPSIVMINYIYMRRILQKNNLLPRVASPQKEFNIAEVI